MKKFLGILLMSVLVGGAAFAQLTPSVSAEASISWGIDLGATKTITPKHGFENHFFAQVLVPLYRGTLSSATEGDVNVSFDIGADLAYRFRGAKDNSTSPYLAWKSDATIDLWRSSLHSMAATLNFWGGYLNVYNRPDFSTNYAQIWSPIRDDGTAWGPETSGDITAFGAKVGYKSDDLKGTGVSLDTGLKLGSNGSWKAAKKQPATTKYDRVELKIGDKIDKSTGVTYYKETVLVGVDTKGVLVLADDKTPHKMIFAGDTVVAGENAKYIKETITTTAAVQGQYAFGWDFSVGYKNLVKFDFGINSTFNTVDKFKNAGIEGAESNKDKIYLGMGFKLSSEPYEGVKLSLASDILFNATTDNKVAADVLFDASYKWLSLGIYYGNKYSAYTGTDKNGDAIGDMAFKLAFASAASGETNLLPGLAFGLDLRLNNVLTYITPAEKAQKHTVPFGLTTWVNYKHNFTDSMWIKPYATLWGETNHSLYKDGSTSTNEYFGVAYKIGITYSPVEKFELDASWAQGGLAWNNYEGAGSGNGMISAPANHRCHNGTFVLSATIRY